VRYLQCDWEHNSPRLPVTVYAEFDDEGWETRKVEVHPSGVLTYANSHTATGSTRLADQKLDFEQALKGTASLKVNHLSKNRFNEIWSQATG